MFFKNAKKWSLSLPEEGWTLHALSRDEIRAIIATLKEWQKSSLLVWKKGWEDWRNISDPACDELLEPRPLHQSAAPAVRTQPEFDDEITQVRSLKPEMEKRERRHRRYLVELPVRIIVGSNEFKTHTKDISLSGLCLQQNLPAWVAGYCAVFIDLPQKGEVDLLCTLVEDQAEQKYRLEILESHHYPVLCEWIEQNLSKAEST